MDRKISDKKKRKMNRRRILKIAVPAFTVCAIITAAILMTSDRIPESDLELSEAKRGDIETSVDATGKIIPAFEETLVSPVSTRIVEVYLHEGDKVEAGTPILRLDLESTETEVRTTTDELNMRKLSTRQSELNSHTHLTNLRMKIKAKEMSVAELKAEVRNEKRLDSIGSGTGERVRQAELTYNSALLELEQMRTELKNEAKVQAAANQSKRLEENITAKNLYLLQHTLEDAQVKAPRDGTLTFVNSSIGSSIGPGEKLAVLADLTRFKITAEIPEGESSRLASGAKVLVRINKKMLEGEISLIKPESANGIVTFTVKLKHDDDPALKSGMRTKVSVIYDRLENVVMIRNGGYYKGPGSYEMFVMTDEGTLEKKRVILGDSNFDYVEVKSGIKEGEKVAVGDMEKYSRHSTLKIKRK